MKKLTIDFYKRENVVLIARELLGKIIVTNIDGITTSGRIVETEAYNGITDKASHAYAGRRTTRTEPMYGSAATAYVYFCYGMHHLFNIVTNQKDIPHAVLVRAVEPLQGIEDMLIRTGKKKLDYTLTKGPGNVAKALGINKLHTGLNLLSNTIFISEDDYAIDETQVSSSPRIGVAYAAEDALLPYRFFIKGNPFVSAKPR
ncbi:MAG: DNA-3-methyladenine glycosylase [Ferruginibacter sp.]|nr:DNA-3-methyladenine glycosylase [Ferruginibacter sp.]